MTVDKETAERWAREDGKTTADDVVDYLLIAGRLPNVAPDLNHAIRLARTVEGRPETCETVGHRWEYQGVYFGVLHQRCGRCGLRDQRAAA